MKKAFKVDTKTLEKIDDLANKTGLSESEIFQEAIAKYYKLKSSKAYSLLDVEEIFKIVVPLKKYKSLVEEKEALLIATEIIKYPTNKSPGLYKINNEYYPISWFTEPTESNSILTEMFFTLVISVIILLAL